MGRLRRFSGSLALLVLLLAASCGAPPPAAPPTAPPPAPAATAAEAVTAADAITVESAFAHVSFLASDEMRGRDTPSPELERAAEYLAAHFEALGLSPAGDDGSFLQRWPLSRLVLDEAASEASVRVGDEARTWRYREDYFVIPSPGAGVDGSPVYAATASVAAGGLPAQVRGGVLMVSLPDGLGPDFGLVLQAAMQAGAGAVLALMDEETDAATVHQIAAALEAGAVGQLPLPVFGVAHEVGLELLEAAGVDPAADSGPPAVLEGVHLTLRGAFTEQVDEVPNVAAVLRGSDPALADTYVILTAHFDHVGVGPPDETGDSIYSGADDNASGTSALLEVATAFASLPEPPARSVLFLAVSGEEKGLLGSDHFANHPTIPAEGMIANLNMDMVSRNAPDTVYAIGDAYTTLGALAYTIAEEHPELGLVVAPDPEPEEQVFLRSDHFSFVQQGVPAIMFTTWLHDDYHAPSDTPDRIDPDKLARVARLAFHLAYRVAHDPEAPAWTDEGRALLETITP